MDTTPTAKAAKVGSIATMTATLTAAGLAVKDVTGSATGYPEPFLGKFVGGFTTPAELRAFLDENPQFVSALAHNRDGWSNVELDYKDMWFGSDALYIQYPFKHGEDPEIFRGKDDVLAYVRGFDHGTFDDIAEDEWSDVYGPDLARTFRHVLADAETTDFSQYALVLHDGYYAPETLPLVSMTRSHDTHHYELGAFWDLESPVEADDEEVPGDEE